MKMVCVVENLAVYKPFLTALETMNYFVSGFIFTVWEPFIDLLRMAVYLRMKDEAFCNLLVKELCWVYIKWPSSE